MTTPGPGIPAADSLNLLRADHVGGLPRPLWLRRRQARFQRDEISAAELELDHQTAVADLVRRQQDIGLPILTDGEVTRRNFQESFGGAVTGYDARPYAYPLTIPAGQPARPKADVVPTVRAPSGMAENGPPVLHRRPAAERLRLSRNLILEEFRRAAAVASVPVKVTLIGPDRIAQRFAHEASREVYPDLDAFVADVVAIERQMIAEAVAAGCRYVQIDEPGYTAYVDQPSLDLMRGRGEDPDANLARGIAADNAVIAGFDDVTFAVHICRGGGGGRGGDWIHREGSYDAIAERLYGELNFDRFLLEYDSDAAGSFDSLRYLPAAKIAVLGLVSNNGGVETRDYLNRRLAAATRHIPVDQVAICPRCGFGASNSTEADIWRKLELITEIADETWPSARLPGGWPPGDHGRELLDVPAGAQFGDVRRAGRAATADQFAHLGEIVLMTRRRDQEQHARRRVRGIGERVRAAGRDEHGRARAAAHDPQSASRFPVVPVARGFGARLECQQIQLAVEDVKELLGLGVQVSSDVKARGDDGLERRPGPGVFVAHLEGHAGSGNSEAGPRSEQ